MLTALNCHCFGDGPVNLLLFYDAFIGKCDDLFRSDFFLYFEGSSRSLVFDEANSFLTGLLKLRLGQFVIQKLEYFGAFNRFNQFNRFLILHLTGQPFHIQLKLSEIGFLK